MSYGISDAIQDNAQRQNFISALGKDHPRAFMSEFFDQSVWMSPDLGRDQANEIFWPAVEIGLLRREEAYTVWPHDFRPVYLNLVFKRMREEDPDLYDRVVYFVKQWG